jgi:D-glycero-D-manno-heptose 1,7-bisphosphate phosphatase
MEIRDRKLYLFDLDDTLTRSISGKKFPETVDDREFIEGRWEKLLDLNKAGKKTAIITNQGGAAWGIFKIEDMENLLIKFCRSALIDAYFVCYRDTSDKAKNSDRTIKELTEPEFYKDWNRRKPAPGMLIEALDHFGIDRLDALYVGDRQEDKGAAENAGIDFQWAWDFFNDGPIMA